MRRLASRSPLGLRSTANALALLPLAAFACAATLAQQPSSPATPAAAKAPALAQNYGKLPLSFEANQGQTDPQVRFLSRGNGYSLFLTNNFAVLALTKSEPCSADSLKESTNPIAPKSNLLASTRTNPHLVISTVAKRSGEICGSTPSQANNKTDTIHMELSNSNPNAAIEGANQLPGTANYFIGNDPHKWHSNVPTYAKVKYAGVYPGVDLVYYGNQRQLEYDFIVQPNANPNQVKLHFAGAAKLTLTPQGDLMVIAKNGEIVFHKPVIYQNASESASDSTSQREPVDGRFELLTNNSVGFTVGTYDRSRELVIDPVLAYSTYLGGAGSDQANAIAVDSTGSAYVTGYTFSAKFPTLDPYQAINSDTSNGVAFVTKLNAEGTALIYSTYLGGSTACGPDTLGISLPGDVGNGIAVDADGNAYVAGQACSKDFPTTKGAFQTINNAANSKAPNAFVIKLDPAGTSLLYSTFVGGTGQSNAGDVAQAIVTDSSGAAYIGGTAFSSNFPTTSGAFQTSNDTFPGDSAFVSKINASGSGLVYSTYLDGASGPSDVSGIAADSAGNAYVTGYVQSRNFPVTSNAFQSSFKGSSPGGVNAFLSKLNPTGSGLLYSTYLGGSGDNTVNYGDYGDGIAIDGAGNAYIGGETYSHDFPISSGSYQTKNNVAVGQPTGFAAKLNTETGALAFSTYMGGSGADAINGIAIDAAGNAYLAGFTYSTDFPTAGGPYQTTNKAAANKSYNAFITELNSTGSSLSYSSYFGGNGVAKPLNGDSAAAIAFSAGGAYMAGAAASTNFPTTASAYQSANKASAGNSNAFIAHFEFTTPSTTTLTSDGNPEPLGAKVTFTADVTGAAGSGTPTGTSASASTKPPPSSSPSTTPATPPTPPPPSPPESTPSSPPTPETQPTSPAPAPRYPKRSTAPPPPSPPSPAAANPPPTARPSPTHSWSW
jgi:hypothetical protein